VGSAEPAINGAETEPLLGPVRLAKVEEARLVVFSDARLRLIAEDPE
jgi:hypothetical protein